MDMLQQTSSDASMYLSFDAESTMSSTNAAFQTMEATTTDISAFNFADAEDVDSEDINANRTLEGDVVLNSPMVKKTKLVGNLSGTPIRPFGKNILNEFTAVSSTPSKEQLLRSVEVVRGSEASRCVDLVNAFKGFHDGNPAHFIAPQGMENKENDQPEGGEDLSNLSSFITEAASTDAERKILMMSTTDEESVQENKQHSKIVKSQEIDVDATPKAFDIVEIKKNTVNAEGNKTEKSKLSFLPRKSICAPKFQTNRPSRIVPKSRKSVLPTTKTEIAPEEDIPKLLNKLLKINDDVEVSAPKSIETDKVRTANEPKSRTSMLPTTAKPRGSTLPTALGEKRTYSYTQRMSIVVKTTLNSPARKVARKTMHAGQQQIRRSVLAAHKPSTSAATSRKSMLPATSRTKSATNNSDGNRNLATVAEQARPTRISVRKSMFPMSTAATSKASADSLQLKAPTVASKLVQKPISFECAKCGSSFRIKSLLDAHKRIHETDTTPPPFVKKPTSGAATTSNSKINQCKFCDKKFVLVRTLHIHLLENCTKIPPSEKRKLEYNELKHVEKAQLPTFEHPNTSKQQSSSQSSSALASSTETVQESKVATPTVATGSISGNKPQMGPPSSSRKIRKRMPHSGVYRTPTKSLPCHICKQTFKSILDYTNHFLTTHSTNNQESTDQNISDNL